MCNKPKTVSCPEPFEPLFLEAEKQMEGFFSSLERKPETGTLTISGERYILARAATFSVQLRKILEEEYGRIAAEKLAYSLGRAAGIKDAEFFMEKLMLERGPAALSAGPVHFAFVGWAYVDIFPESAPTTDENYYLIYDHPYSFEADAYMREKIETDRPVCLMNAGYSSGWCQVAFGVELAAREITCRANGDDQCIFVMGHTSRIHEYVVEAQERYGKLD
ncbi:V4R domain-containing protein [Solemya velesiana gill symbiont]|uniref:V4R domain-containing protein n=1 Tax=Solemya velesiana gill symbiont TaxID=1918948 RepID=UPI0009962A49|nr:V4R domain-containing protein [Solemya velesiana gill symbiont]